VTDRQTLAEAHDLMILGFPDLAREKLSGALEQLPDELVSGVLGGDIRFHAALDELAVMHEQKNADYGATSDPYANVRAGAAWGVEPWVAAMVRASDKIRRLQLFAETGTLRNEGVEDSLLDLASYALIALLLFRETKEGN